MLTHAKRWRQPVRADDPKGSTQMRPGGLYSLQRRGQTVQVGRGRAWITFDGEDHILEPGDRLRLPQGKDRALVSALGTAPLDMTIR